jgi:hypothetical protein
MAWSTRSITKADGRDGPCSKRPKHRNVRTRSGASAGAANWSAFPAQGPVRKEGCRGHRKADEPLVSSLLAAASIAFAAAATPAGSMKDCDLWRHPYEVFQSVVVPANEYQTVLSFNVPAGQRAVLECASIFLSVQEGKSAYCYIQAGFNPTTSSATQTHTLVLYPQGPDHLRAGQVVFHASQRITMTADHASIAGIKDLQVLCNYASPSTQAKPIIFRASLSGHLVKLPGRFH